MTSASASRLGPRAGIVRRRPRRGAMLGVLCAGMFLVLLDVTIMLLPGSLALITAIFPGRAEQARAMGLWAAISSTALPAGPLLGGFLVDAAGWRWIFLLNVPIVAAALVGVVLLVDAGEPDAPRGRGRRRLDRGGMLLAPLALAALVWTVICAGHGDLSVAVSSACVAVAASATG